MLFTDSHCHLDTKVLSPFLDGILLSARAKGVCRFIVPGTHRAAWQDVLALSHSYAKVFPALGMHPCFEHRSFTSDLVELTEILESGNTPVVAVGEVGLDRRFPDLPLQASIFEAQAWLAKEYSKPLIVHSVKAHAHVLKILKTVGVNSGVIHAFSGSYEEAMGFIDQGFSLGVGSVVMRTRGKTANAFAKVPLSSLLLETDSPDMYLPAAKSRLGTPMDVISIAQALSDLREISLVSMAVQLESNVDALFTSLHKCGV